MVHPIVNNIPALVQDALKLPKEQQRLRWYTDKIPKQKWLSIYYVDEDDAYVYSQCCVHLRMASHLFPQSTDRKGFRFDKKTKKLTMWYGCKFDQLTHLFVFLEKIGREWVTNEGFTPWLTKGLLEKILAGKITNPLDACKYIIKANRLKCSPKLLKDYIKDNATIFNRSRKIELFMIKDAVTNLDHWLEGGCEPYGDLVRQCKALGRTFDPKWSERRREDFHQELTRELMKAEIDSVDDYVVDWPEFKFPEGMELIVSKRRCFEEGTLMSHCIYTNYWHKIEQKRYLAVHITDSQGNKATAGFTLYSGVPRLDQCNARRNTNPSVEIGRMVDDLRTNDSFIKHFTVKKFVDEYETLPF